MGCGVVDKEADEVISLGAMSDDTRRAFWATAMGKEGEVVTEDDIQNFILKDLNGNIENLGIN